MNKTNELSQQIIQNAGEFFISWFRCREQEIFDDYTNRITENLRQDIVLIQKGEFNHAEQEQSERYLKTCISKSHLSYQVPDEVLAGIRNTIENILTITKPHYKGEVIINIDNFHKFIAEKDNRVDILISYMEDNLPSNYNKMDDIFTSKWLLRVKPDGYLQISANSIIYEFHNNTLVKRGREVYTKEGVHFEKKLND